MDKVLQGRLFSYPDIHRHRLNKAKVYITRLDGLMFVNVNQGNNPNYMLKKLLNL